MHTVAVVQARMGSTRLPGKVLADVGGLPMLTWVIGRTRLARTIDHLIVACPSTAADERLIQWCLDHEIALVCGPEHDVLTRYVMAARLTDADVIVRITADCPLIDPEVIDGTVRSLGGRDWASCIHPDRTWPDGLDVEVMTRATLERLDQLTTEAADREHVTPLLYRGAVGSGQPFRSGLPLGALRWTVDTAADLQWLRRLAAQVPWYTRWREILMTTVGQRWVA